MTENEVPEEEKTIPFFPDHLLTEARVAVVILLIIVGIGIFALRSPVGLGEPADPMNTPAHTKPEWYFLFLYEILKYVSKSVGSILPFVAVFILLIWPFIDRKTDNKRARRIRIILVMVVMLAVIGLTLLSELG
jgi:quinol-cytochrome oxidoreductase complex cytochrome b subunit